MEFNSCTENELWQYVATALKKSGIKTTLVGGAVVAIYSKGAYRSGDLDIVVNSFLVQEKQISETMQTIGFTKEGRHWKHPECKHLFVEFVRTPLGIGEDTRIFPKSISVNETEIFILSPEDCVRDRLASYVYFKAAECLDQAALVAIAENVVLDNLQNWGKNEGAEMIAALGELKGKVEKMANA